MQNFGALSRWYDLSEKDKIDFERNETVKIEVTTPPTTLWWYGKGKKETLLAVTTGKDCLQFAPEARTYLRPSQPVKYKTAKNVKMHVPHSGAETFTEPYIPAERHPEMERIAHAAAVRATQRANAIHSEQQRRMQLQIDQMKKEQDAAVSQQAGGDGAAKPAAKADGNSDAPTPAGGKNDTTDPARQDQKTPAVGVPDNKGGTGDELPDGDDAAD